MIVVRDRDVQSLHDSTEVVITVVDDNDHAPSITWPSPGNDTVYVSTRAPVGSLLTRVVCHDDDQGDNARLVFTIQPNSLDGATGRTQQQQLFRIDPVTGELFVNGSLADFDMETFRLDLQVRDSGTPSQVAMATLYVEVQSSIPVGVGSGPVEARVSNNAGFMMQLLELPVNGHKLVVILSLLIGCFIIVLASCCTLCIVIRRRNKALHFNDKNKG